MCSTHIRPSPNTGGAVGSEKGGLTATGRHEEEEDSGDGVDTAGTMSGD